MSTTSPSFSFRNVLLLVVPLALLTILGFGYAYRDVTLETPKQAGLPVAFLKMHLVSPRSLDEGLVDADGDMVADAPKDAALQVDPETLVFNVLGENSDEEKKTFQDFVTHLEKATGKKVALDIWPESYSFDNQLQAVRKGDVHLVALSTGSVSAGVNRGGAVPFAVIANDEGKFGYHVELVVPASSTVTKPEELKGKRLSVVSPESMSSFKAPVVILWKEFGLQPGRDYQPQIEASRMDIIESIAKGEDKKVQAGSIASDYLSRGISKFAQSDWAKDQKLDADAVRKKIRTIYTSPTTFPPECYAHCHQLKPELAKKVAEAFVTFHFAKTSLADRYAVSGQTKFVPISYKTDWAPVRAMEDTATQLLATTK